METGRKIILPNNNIAQDQYHILSIQVSLGGLSFCVLNTKTNSFSFFKHIRFDKKLNPGDLLDKLIHYFNTEKDLQQTFKAVKVIHDNELSALVPKPLFNEEFLADYLKFNSKILRTDFITYDTISANDSVNVYVPYVNFNNYLYDRFGAFEFKHFSTVILETLLRLEKHSTTTKMFVNINDDHFEIIVLDHNQLKLYNTFEYHTKEDFIYYILFTAEQLDLNPEELALVLLGKISETNSLYEIAYTYIRNVSILKSQNLPKVGTDINTDILLNFILTNSF